MALAFQKCFSELIFHIPPKQDSELTMPLKFGLQFSECGWKWKWKIGVSHFEKLEKWLYLPKNAS